MNKLFDSENKQYILMIFINHSQNNVFISFMSLNQWALFAELKLHA